MRGCLVRVGIDSTCGHFNSPVETDSMDYFYIPIPQSDSLQHEGMETPYLSMLHALKSWSKKHNVSIELPLELQALNAHLDPDFETLTYGDQGTGRGANLSKLTSGDFLVFYGSFRDIHSSKLIYALFGIYFVAKKLSVKEALDSGSNSLLNSNAHLRLRDPNNTDIIFIADPHRSGRFSSLIPVGSYRDGAYRVERKLLEKWGGLGTKDGFIQRSANPPFFENPEQFISWLETERERNIIKLERCNWAPQE